MRIGIANIASETSTFNPVPTDMETIRASGIDRGQKVLEFSHWGNHIAGFLDVVGGEEFVGITRAVAEVGGPLTEEAMSTIVGWFTEDLREALPLDRLLLSLHGAFAGVADPDVEGLVVRRAREILGDAVIIEASMDLHANITGKDRKCQPGSWATHSPPCGQSRGWTKSGRDAPGYPAGRDQTGHERSQDPYDHPLLRYS